jgi:hypothetical protein
LQHRIGGGVQLLMRGDQLLVDLLDCHRDCMEVGHRILVVSKVTLRRGLSTLCLRLGGLACALDLRSERGEAGWFLTNGTEWRYYYDLRFWMLAAASLEIR